MPDGSAYEHDAISPAVQAELDEAVEIWAGAGKSADLFPDAKVGMTTTATHQTIKLKEKYDENVMASMLIDPDLDNQTKKQLRAYLRNRIGIATVEVEYVYAKGLEDKRIGRLYPKGGLGLATMRGVVRDPLHCRYYHDIDIENAHYNIALQLARKWQLRCDAIQYYCDNRVECLNKVSTERGVAKVQFLKVLYGGAIDEVMDTAPVKEKLSAKVKPSGQQLLETIKSEVDGVMDYAWAHYPELRDIECGSSGTAFSKRRDPKSSLFALVCHEEEKNMLLALKQHMEENGRTMGVLIHDGGRVEKIEGEEHFPSELLVSGAAAIEAATGYKVRLAVKQIQNNYVVKQALVQDETARSRLRWQYVWEKNGSSMSKLYMLEKGNTVIYSVSEKQFYLYRADKGLWTQRCPQDINNDFTEVCSSAVRKMVAEVDDKYEDGDKRKAATELLMSVLKYIASTATTIVNNYLATFCVPEFEPRVFFNNADPDLYPCANGAYRFSTRTLEPYKPEHYFTFKVPVEFDPEADYSDLEHAMNQWFANDTAVVAFIKYWLGYCLTPETNRQEFLVVWGETAGNGKSTLFGDIFPLIMRLCEGNTRDSYEHTLNIKDLMVQNSANSDSTYNLAGKRFARMSEPKLEGKQKLDNEMVKRLTGDSTYSVSAKYKNEITFRPVAKIVALCNAMMKVDCDDAGILRRLLVVEMNTKFVSQAALDALTPAELESGHFQLRDEKLITRIKGNLPGVLRYFLEGASDYVSDPEHAVPDVMRSSKDKAQNNLDDITQWIRGNLVKTDEKKKHIKLADLKAHFRTNQVKFETKNYNEKGFNELFFKKCEAAGFTVKFDPKRPDMGRIENVVLYEEAETDAE